MTEYPPFPFEKSEAGQTLESKEEIRKRIDALITKEDAMIQELIAKNPYIKNKHFEQLLTAIVLTTALAVGGMKESLGESATAFAAESSAPAVVSAEKAPETQNELGGVPIIEIQSLIEKRYLYPVDTSQCRTLSLENISSCLDEYSGYESPEPQKRLTSGDYSGVGAFFKKNTDGKIFVFDVPEELPATRAGLRRGDRVISIRNAEDQTELMADDFSLDNFLLTIRGKEKSKVWLTVEREGAIIALPVIERAHILGQRTFSRQELPNGIGYVRFPYFMPFVADGFEETLKQLQETGHLRALVLDLRENQGGLQNEAFRIMRYFVASGNPEEIIITKQYKDRETVIRLENAYVMDAQSNTKMGSGISIQCPTIILINNRTKSSSEIVADVLHESGRAILVGTQSSGKAVEQTTFPLSNGAYLKLTTAKLLYGERRHDIHTKGIIPDVSIAWEKKDGQSDAEFMAEHLKNLGNPEKDPQLKKALEILQEKITQSSAQ